MKIQTKYGEAVVLLDCPLVDSSESLEWLTEIHESYNGNELRYALRDAPRQTLSFNYTAIGKSVGDFFNLLYANLRGLWAIPLPMFKREFPSIDGDFIAFNVEPTIADLRIDSYAIIQSNEGAQVVEIIERGRYVITQEELRDEEDNIIQELITEYQDGFRLSESVTADNATMMPLRMCVLDGEAALTIGHQWSNPSLVFRVIAEDSPEYEAALPQQYKGKDIYFDDLMLDGSSLAVSLTQHQNIVDNAVGAFQSYTHHNKPKYIKPMKSILKTWQEYYSYRNFLFRREGCCREFWKPTHERNINFSNTGAIGATLYIDTKFTLEAKRKHIAIRYKSGEWSAHEITSVSSTALTISPLINSDANLIDFVSYLGLYRFDSDNATISFLGGEVSKIIMPIVEIDN